jgi:hypothetical protein
MDQTNQKLVRILNPLKNKLETISMRLVLSLHFAKVIYSTDELMMKGQAGRFLNSAKRPILQQMEGNTIGGDHEEANAGRETSQKIRCIT